jgi:hypothetical protein
MYWTYRQTSSDQVSKDLQNSEPLVGTPYEGGIFRCKLVVDSEFPQKPPKGKKLRNTLTKMIDRVLYDEDFPSKCCRTFRRNLCKHAKKRLEPD